MRKRKEYFIWSGLVSFIFFAMLFVGVGLSKLKEDEMLPLILRYVFGLVCGLILGLVYPVLGTWWVLFFVGAFVGEEIYGGWGYGRHWGEYRFAEYILSLGPVISAILGILLGSGTIGTWLVAVGTLISR